MKANLENNNLLLYFIFSPLQMISLYRDPKGEYIFGEKTSTLNRSQLAASMTANNINERTKFTESLPKVAESSLNH